MFPVSGLLSFIPKCVWW